MLPSRAYESWTCIRILSSVINFLPVVRILFILAKISRERVISEGAYSALVGKADHNCTVPCKLDLLEGRRYINLLRF